MVVFELSISINSRLRYCIRVIVALEIGGSLSAETFAVFNTRRDWKSPNILFVINTFY